MAIHSTKTCALLAEIATTIRSLRQQRLLSQQALANRLGVSRMTVRALESGKPSVALGTAIESLHILGTQLLLENTQSPVLGQPKKIDLDDDF